MMKKEEDLNMNLAAFYDDFEEFNDYCSFLCDAISSLFCEYQDCEPDPHTILGAKRHCSWLKCRAEELKKELHDIYERSYTDPKVTKLKPPTP